MMIGPEPMTRIRCRSVRLGIEQIVDDVVVRLSGRPAGLSRQFGRRADEHWCVRSPHERWFGRNVSGDARSKQDTLGELSHGDADTATHVVDLARASTLGKEKIRTHDVVDVEK